MHLHRDLRFEWIVHLGVVKVSPVLTVFKTCHLELEEPGVHVWLQGGSCPDWELEPGPSVEGSFSSVS